jgi:general secretion pathway protein H
MPTSAPGNRGGAGNCATAAKVGLAPSGGSPGGGTFGWAGRTGREVRQTRARGFTLIELLIVVAIVALASTLATLALRDPDASALEREADRLSALLEAARAESRASGLTARWVPAADAAAVEAGAPHFRFVGLPAALNLPQRWLTPQVQAEVVGARSLLLGPEPLIGAQRVSLRLGDQRLTLATEGLGPFEVQHAQTSGATPADREARAGARP